MTIREKIDRKMVELAAAKVNLKNARIASVEAEEWMAWADEARTIVQGVGQTLQQEAHSRLAGVVSTCLESVFDEPYEFKIVFEKKRGQTEARLVFVRDGMEINPLDAAGGGVVDVASFALRLSCLMLRRPASRRLLVLDEPMKFVSAGYRARIRQMLENLAEKMSVQVLLVTHIPEITVGKEVELQ